MDLALVTLLDLLLLLAMLLISVVCSRGLVLGHVNKLVKVYLTLLLPTTQSNHPNYVLLTETLYQLILHQYLQEVLQLLPADIVLVVDIKVGEDLAQLEKVPELLLLPLSPIRVVTLIHNLPHSLLLPLSIIPLLLLLF